MPTVITHAAVPLCIGLGLGSKAIPPRLLFAGIILAMLPDADVLSFKFGVAYGNVFGHRGFTHSLVFAFVVPLLCVLIGRRWFRAGLIRCWLFLTVSLLSHSLLDSVTTGGKWVGWLWPWSDGPYIFDPACYWGDRECDLAMLPLHTEQPPQIYDGYQSVSPLPADFLERQPVYQLYTLLNRARLFGGQHLVIAQQSLDRLLAA